MQASSASSSIQRPSDHRDPATVRSVSEGQTDVETDEAPALEALTDFPDAPFERVDLPRVSVSSESGEEQDLTEVEEPADASRPPPEWCVETGGSMLAMSTFELWMALARGEVDGKTSVFRNGMDGWDNVENIPELSYALADSLSLAPPPVLPTPTEVISVRTNDRTPLTFATEETSDTRVDVEAPVESGPISRHWKGFSFKRGRIALAAAGFAAVAAAVGLSFVPRPSEVSSAPTDAASTPVAMARLHSAMERANRAVDEATQRRLEADQRKVAAPVSSSARQHKEVGQRRTRRGRKAPQ